MASRGRATASGERIPSRWRPVARARLRRIADAQLLGGAAPEAFPHLHWRALELTSARNRRAAARSLRSLLAELDGRRLPGASPLNRAAARPHARLIETLADRLEDVTRPVSARGVLLVARLLADGAGPLYARERAGELPQALAGCLRVLEQHARGRARVHAAGRIGDR